MSTPASAPAKEPTSAAAGTVVTDPPAAAPAPAPGAPAAAAAPAAPPAGGEPAKPAPAKPEGTPAEVKLELPKDSKLDPGFVERITADIKAGKLTQEQGQARVNEASESVATYMKGQNDTYAQEQKAWVEALKADKEIGGTAFDESVTLAKRTVDTFGTPEFKKALNETGLGNHPELVRIFARIGRNIVDDKFVRPGALPAAKKSPEQVFYPDTPAQ